jgi:hypothetical protein
MRPPEDIARLPPVEALLVDEVRSRAVRAMSLDGNDNLLVGADRMNGLPRPAPPAIDV